MKYYNPKNLKPSSDEFYRFTKDKLSAAAQQSLSYKATASLFGTARRLYDTLNSTTSERLAIFVDSNTYLSQRQEHDLIALTVLYTAQLDMQLVREIIEQDQATNESEKAILLAAIELYRASTESAYAALGNPRWVEDSRHGGLGLN